MSCKSIVIDGVEFVASHPVSSKGVVLVRTCNSGVHVGELDGEPTGQRVVLKNAHRVWRWRGANTLSELSQEGGDTAYTRISKSVPGITLLDALEVIPCSEDAAKNLRTARWPD